MNFLTQDLGNLKKKKKKRHVQNSISKKHKDMGR